MTLVTGHFRRDKNRRRFQILIRPLVVSNDLVIRLVVLTEHGPDSFRGTRSPLISPQESAAPGASLSPS